MVRSSEDYELLESFSTEMFGHAPNFSYQPAIEILQRDLSALQGQARRSEIAVHLLGDTTGPTINLQLWLPTSIKTPVPLFLGANFFGNHAVLDDPTIPITTNWMRDSERPGHVVNNRATEISRGSEASRWQVQEIIKRGYGLATYYYGDIEPDHPEGWQTGIRGALLGTNQSRPGDHEWGAIAAWAWGLSRCLDYLETDSRIDNDRIAVIGHSRLGKAALWAGAIDQRFAMVIANNSGAGGASLARHLSGESIADLNRAFPHWFAGNFHKYNAHESDLPFDMHQLLALIAPRSLYVASAAEDLWADPEGERLSVQYAAPAFAQHGKQIGYHIREGKHDVTAYDWSEFLNFADANL